MGGAGGERGRRGKGRGPPPALCLRRDEVGRCGVIEVDETARAREGKELHSLMEGGEGKGREGKSLLEKEKEEREGLGREGKKREGKGCEGKGMKGNGMKGSSWHA